MSDGCLQPSSNVGIRPRHVTVSSVTAQDHATPTSMSDGDGGKSATVGPIGCVSIPGPNCARSPQQTVLPSAWTAQVVSSPAAMRTVSVTSGTGIGVFVSSVIEPRPNGPTG